MEMEYKDPSRRGRWIVVIGVALAIVAGGAAFFLINQAQQEAGQAGLQALVEGNVGKMKDFFIFRSQLVPKTGGTTVNTHNLAFCRDAIGLVMRRLPQPLPGTGAIAEYAEMGNFGIRVVMSYQPNTLAQQFTVDVLYGAAVLRNNFAVQVNS